MSRLALDDAPTSGTGCGPRNGIAGREVGLRAARWDCQHGVRVACRVCV